METLNNIEKITLLISLIVVVVIHLFILLNKAKNKINTNQLVKICSMVIVLMSSFFINAQDTIHFKNKTVVVAKIMEIGISEIKYQRFDNLNGPNYLSSKNEIFLIVYSNGARDTIKSIVVVEPININRQLSVNPDRLRLSGNKIIYHERAISDRKLYSMISDHPSSETQLILKKEFKKLNEYKLKEAALAPGLFLAGAGIHLAALGSAFGVNGGAGFNNSSNLVSAFVAGAVLRISGHVVNIVYRNKKKNKRSEIVDIYNGY